MKNVWNVTSCETSSDCPATTICCEIDSLVSTESNSRACSTPKNPSLCDANRVCEVTACATSEVCVEGQPCRSPSTVCRGGKCVRSDVHLPCGRETCTGGDVCCFANTACLTCTSPGRCGSLKHFECAGPRDCPAGTTCCSPPWGGSYCDNRCYNASSVCHDASDCQDPIMGSVRLKCLEFEDGSAPPGYRVCSY